jgi:hypothetical protein
MWIGRQAHRVGKQMREFITTDASDRYHATADCWGFKAGRQGGEVLGFDIHRIRSVSIAEAEAESKTPCKVCIPL